MHIDTINPTTGELAVQHILTQDQQIEKTLVKASKSFCLWKSISISNRSKLMKKLAKLFKKNIESFAKMMATEMGKPINQGRQEVLKCAMLCDFYSEKSSHFLEAEKIKLKNGDQAYVTFEPLGAILGVMVWNYPFWQVMRFAVPTIMAGNVAILKHSSKTFSMGIAIEKLFLQAGFPSNVFTNLLIDSKKVKDLIHSPIIKAVSFTGGVLAGRDVAMHAGSALKKSVLELGGSDPSIILADASILDAAKSCAQSRLQNSGQSCIATKRIIVIESIKDKFEEALESEMKKFKVGNPLSEDVMIGPLAKSRFRDKLHNQVVKSIDKGAKCIIGGIKQVGKGAFYPPTILINVEPGMPAYDEELFGPVVSIISVKDEQEAIKVANDTRFGLGSSIYTKNIKKARELAAKLDSGSCFINTFVQSLPKLPFGGIKESGYGRELSHYGLKEFSNIKTNFIASR